MGIDLPLLWAIIILFAIMMYVIMDGFDLGIGILFPFFETKEERDLTMNTIAPVWDGNETWLVLGGAGLMAAFPRAYAAILSAFYLPIILMLIGLIFRGVAFEFRFKAEAHRQYLWDRAFIGGSLLATFCQGVVLGAYIRGLKLNAGTYAGGAFDWLSPFSLLTGFGLIVAYVLLGSTWLVIKTEGELHARMRVIAAKSAWVVLGLIVVISIWTPLVDARISARWFSLPNLLFFAPVPLLVLAFMALLLRSLRGSSHSAPFVYALCLVFLCYSGLGISLFPNILPPDVTIWQAAAPPQSMGFALVGALLIIPIILMYTAWGYYVFRGKVKPGEHYH
jgi:cytochrome d ubiquinol oxidase subunit II